MKVLDCVGNEIEVNIFGSILIVKNDRFVISHVVAYGIDASSSFELQTIKHNFSWSLLNTNEASKFAYYLDDYFKQ